MGIISSSSRSMFHKRKPLHCETLTRGTLSCTYLLAFKPLGLLIKCTAATFIGLRRGRGILRVPDAHPDRAGGHQRIFSCNKLTSAVRALCSAPTGASMQRARSQVRAHTSSEAQRHWGAVKSKTDRLTPASHLTF